MSHINESGYKTYLAGGDLVAGTAVKLSSGKVVTATAATDFIIGTVAAAVKSGWQADVRLRNAQGTINIVAGGNIAVGDAVTANGTGKGVKTTTTGDQIVGYALEAGSANAIIELMPVLAKY